MRPSCNVSVFLLAAALLLPCLTGCGSDGGGEKTCQGCLIGGACYDDREHHPDNPCLVCAVAADPGHWTDDDGVACDDGLFCTEESVCQGGACVVRAQRQCDDGLYCNGVEYCDEQAGACASTGPPPCDDGLFCNGAELCDEEQDACVPGEPPCPEDGLFCNGVETCDEEQDACASPGAPCAAGDVCYEEEDACCTPDAYLDCDTHGDVAAYDSCGHELGMVEDCTWSCSRGVCGCPPGWTRPDCDVCVVYVHGAAGSDENTGRSWDQALQTVQAGADVGAQDDCEVWVTAGTYKPTVGEGRAASIRLHRSVFITYDWSGLYGGFAGDEVTREQRDTIANRTILSGDIGVEGDDTDNAFHVVTGDYHALLDGFVITGGRAEQDDNPDNPNNCGGGMFNNEVEPILRNCVFEDNRAVRGGAVYQHRKYSDFLDCTFRDNAAKEGGAVHLREAGSGYERCVFENNRAEAGAGGAIFSNDRHIDLSACRFEANQATGDGGAIRVWDAWGGIHRRWQGTTFVNNASGGRGGAAYIEHSSFLVAGCVFAGNTAAGAGGGMAAPDSDALVESCIFQNNTAGEQGGGLFASDCSISTEDHSVVVNCTFQGNAAVSGAGVYLCSDSDMMLANTILWGDAPDELFVDTNATVDLVQCHIQDGASPPPGFASTDPDDPRNLRLLPGSPCIDAGDASLAPEQDIDGRARYDLPDVGACEWWPGDRTRRTP